MFASSKKTLIAVAAVALVAITGSTANAQFRVDVSRPGVSFRWASSRHERVDNLARQLERDARALNHEVDHHFRNSPWYRRFEAMVDQIVREADHIHDVAHRGGSLHHLRSDVAKLDRFFHATERLFDDMIRSGRYDRQTVFHIKSALNRVERDIHALHDLVD